MALMDFLKTATSKTNSSFNNLISSYTQPKTASASTSSISRPISFNPNSTAYSGASYSPVQNAPMSTNSPMSKPVNQTQLTTAPVKASNLTSTPVYDTTYSSGSNYGNSLSSGANQVVEQATRPTARETALKQMGSLIDKQGEQGQRALDLQGEYGLSEKEQRLNEINAKALEVDRAYEKKTRELRKNAEGKLTGNLDNEVFQLGRERDERLADIGIEQAIAQGNVDTATKLIQSKLDAEFEPIAQQIESLQNYYSLYGDDLTASEKIMLENQIEQQTNALKSEYESSQISQGSQAFTTAVMNGDMELKDIPKEYLPYVTAQLNQSGFISKGEQASADKTRSTLSLISEIAGGDLGLAVGPGWQQAVGNIASFAGFGGGFKEKQAKIAQLKSLLTFDNLSQLKGLGAMSDREFATITASASALREDMTDEQFRTELGKISGILTDKLINSPATTFEDKVVLLKGKIKSEYPNATDDEIADIIDQSLPFNSVGNTTASTIANAIKTVESQGNYNAKGASGEFGAYQFMPSTWQQWAGEFLGNPNAQPNQANQDKVAMAKINQLIQQGYNAEQIALIWNGGSPVVKKGVNKYGVEYDSGSYAQKVISQLRA